ncbi:MAG TPA: LuxR family transcriptional regulator [Streptosporangiaceae bacterium]|nr:LuxR family transcriptional regulator [Streptosporangiaceae bacterium]
MRRTLTSEIPLMSRDAEMSSILAELKRPEPAAFVLAGAAGVGKTRLASEVARSATSLGYATVQAVASRAVASIPFGPFAPLLPAGGHSPGNLLGLLRQASDAILERAGTDRRLLLVVDDAQFLDEGSAALVHQLVQKGACSVLASLRTPGPAPEPVTALWKDGLAQRIDIGTWGETQTEALITTVLDGPVASGSVRRLWELSGGNALYLRELLIGAVESGALCETGGIWALRMPLTAPGRLVELVASRLAGLAPETVRVVELLAVGEPLGVQVLEKTADPAGLEDAEAQGLVQVYQDGRRTDARLAHPVYGEALRQSLPRSRLRRISAELAAAVEVTGARRREDLLRLGRWQLDAGGPGEPTVLSRAARRASEMFDMELSARLAQAALDLGGGVDAGLLLGEAKFRSGHHVAAETVLASVVPMCRTDSELARIASARAHNFHNLMADPAAATAVLNEALAVITEADPRLQLLGRLATLKVFEPDLAGALAAAKPLLGTSDDVMVSRGAYVSSIALAMLGHGDEAVSVAEIGLRSHRRATGMPQMPEAQLIGAVLGHAATGRLDRAEEDSATGYRACLAAGDKEGYATHLLLTGWVLVERGQLGRAATAFLDAVSVNRELHDLAALRWCLAGLALAEAMRGRTERAMTAAAERDELPVGSMRVWEPDLTERGRAWLNVATGELSAACDTLAAAAAQAAAVDQRFVEARLLHDIARLGQPDTVADRLAALAEVTGGGLVPAFAGHAAALVSVNAPGLEAAGRAFETAGAYLLAAETDLAAAAAYRSEGYARPASALTRRAGELATLCGEVRTPGLSFGTDQERLTPREREVASMAAAGASSREIAAKLVLSVRTVDNHLQNAYSKLGVTSRAELARVLRS